MTQIVDEIRGLFAYYPPWLVITCLVVVGIGMAYVLWRVVKFSLMVIVTLLLVALIGFAGWVILTS